MVEYSEVQQKIAKSLLESPKTLEELREELGVSASELNEELAGLLKLRVVERKEDKYKLIDLVEKAVKGAANKPIEGKFQAYFIIEATSLDKESLEKQLGLLEEKIKKENVRVDEIKRLDAIENKGVYNAYIETTISADSLFDMINFVINYGPTSVEVIKPKTEELNTRQIQEILQQVSSAVYYYTTLIIQLKHAQLVKKMLEKQQQAEQQKD